MGKSRTKQSSDDVTLIIEGRTLSVGRKAEDTSGARRGGFSSLGGINRAAADALPRSVAGPDLAGLLEARPAKSNSESPSVELLVEIDGVKFNPLSEEETVRTVMRRLDEGTGGLIVTPNLSLMRSSRARGTRSIIESADLVVCDGMPLLWLTRLQGDRVPERVTGASLIWSLSRGAALAGRSIYVIGGLEGAAAGAASQLATSFPGLRVAGASCPPYGFEKDPKALEEVLRSVITSAPDVVFVGLGFPKQEQLCGMLREGLPGAWFVGCGAAVNFAGSKQKRAPAWMQRSGLEWVHRLLTEPRRLGPRYLMDASYGLRLLLRVIWGRVQIETGRFPNGDLPIRSMESHPPAQSGNRQKHDCPD